MYSLKTESFKQNNLNIGRIGIFASNDLTQWPEEIVIYKKENFFNAILYGIEETYKFTYLMLTFYLQCISVPLFF